MVIFCLLRKSGLRALAIITSSLMLKVALIAALTSSSVVHPSINFICSVLVLLSARSLPFPTEITAPPSRVGRMLVISTPISPGLIAPLTVFISSGSWFTYIICCYLSIGIGVNKTFWSKNVCSNVRSIKGHFYDSPKTIQIHICYHRDGYFGSMFIFKNFYNFLYFC